MWQKHIYSTAGGQFIGPDELESEKPSLIIDAVIGYSLISAPRGTARDLIGWSNNQIAPVLSLDIPSGIDSSTAEPPGIYIKATRTMTLALPKIDLINPAIGEIMLTDIGIPANTFRRARIQFKSPFDDSFHARLQRETGEKERRQ